MVFFDNFRNINIGALPIDMYWDEINRKVVGQCIMLGTVLLSIVNSYRLENDKIHENRKKRSLDTLL